jgi:hypothetical protein
MKELANELDKAFQMRSSNVKKHMKKCSPSLPIKEPEIQNHVNIPSHSG